MKLQLNFLQYARGLTGRVLWTPATQLAQYHQHDDPDDARSMADGSTNGVRPPSKGRLLTSSTKQRISELHNIRQQLVKEGTQTMLT